MKGSLSFNLSSSVKVFLHPQKVKKERLISLSNSGEISNELKIMEDVGNFFPFSLLVYEKVLVWGRYFPSKKIILDFTDYSDKLFEGWVDCSFSFKKSPVRVVKKLDDLKEFNRRISLRTKFDWISYNSKTNILKELQYKPCGIKKFLSGKKPKKEIYSLIQDGKKIKINCSKIMEIPSNEGGRERNFMCYNEVVCCIDTIKKVRENILSSDKDALIVEEPLICCSGSIANLPPCISDIFLRDYLEKLHLKVEKSEDYKINKFFKN